MLARVVRGTLFLMSLTSLLAWLYVVTRILWTGIIPRGVIVFDVYLSFWVLGIIAFIVSFVFMVLFVIAGGFPRGSRSSGRA